MRIEKIKCCECGRDLELGSDSIICEECEFGYRIEDERREIEMESEE